MFIQLFIVQVGRETCSFVRLDCWGVQFHPESILTSEGKKIRSSDQFEMELLISLLKALLVHLHHVRCLMKFFNEIVMVFLQNSIMLPTSWRRIQVVTSNTHTKVKRWKTLLVRILSNEIISHLQSMKLRHIRPIDIRESSLITSHVATRDQRIYTTTGHTGHTIRTIFVTCRRYVRMVLLLRREEH